MSTKSKSSATKYSLGPNSIFYDKDKLAKLVKDYENGMPWKDIEAKYKVSHGTAYNALRCSGAIKEGTHRMSINQKTIDEVIEDYSTGMNIYEISRKYNISHEVIRKIFDRYQIKQRKYETNKKLNTQELVDALVKAYQAGMKWKDMIDQFGVSGSTIVRTLKNAGIKTGSRKKKSIDESEYSELVERYKNGAHWCVMSKRFGVDTKTIVSTLSHLGVNVDKGNRRRINENTLKEIIIAYKSGMTWKAIEAKFNIPSSTIRSVLKREGIQANTRKKVVRRKCNNGAVKKISLSEDKMSKLKELYESGTNWEVILKEIGLDEKHCRALLRKMGVELKRKKGYSEEEKEKIKALYFGEKASIKEVAYLLHDEPFHIERFLMSCGIEIRDEKNVEFMAPVVKLTETHKLEIMRLRKQNYTIREIASAVKLSYGQVKAFIKRANKSKA